MKIVEILRPDAVIDSLAGQTAHAVLVELSAAYCRMAALRIKADAPLLADVAAESVAMEAAS